VGGKNKKTSRKKGIDVAREKRGESGQEKGKLLGSKRQGGDLKCKKRTSVDEKNKAKNGRGFESEGENQGRLRRQGKHRSVEIHSGKGLW